MNFDPSLRMHSSSLLLLNLTHRFIGIPVYNRGELCVDVNGIVRGAVKDQQMVIYDPDRNGVNKFKVIRNLPVERSPSANVTNLPFSAL